MKDLTDLLSALDLGELRRHIPLEGELPYPGGGSARATLVQTGRGAWLVAQASGRAPLSRALARNPTLRLETRLLGDRLHLDGHSFGIPLGRSGDVRLAIGAGRVFAEHPISGPLVPPRGVFCEEGAPVEDAWLRANLADGERVLAWLQTSEHRSVPSEIISEQVAPIRYLLTPQRALLVAINEVGDVKAVELPQRALEAEDGGGRRAVRCSHHAWTSTRSNGPRFRALALVQAQSPGERLRRVAQSNHGANPQLATSLLAAIQEPSALDLLLLGLLSEQQPDLLPQLQALEREHESGTELLQALSAWSLQGPALMTLVRLGVDANPASAEWYLPLHREAHQAAQGDASEAAAADLALAEHLLLASRQQEAVVLLEDRFASLPDEQLSDLLPPQDADLTEGQAGQALRIRTLELLAAARAEQGQDLPTLLELARLQPLVSERLQSLRDQAAQDPEQRALQDRAEQVLGLHASLAPSDTDPYYIGSPATLSSAQLDYVQHPAARDEGTLGWMQGWIAKQRRPDPKTIKNYCERLSPQRHQAAVHAVTGASLALGVPGVEAYISHGELAHGLRAYDDKPAYLLIGGAHLYDEDADYMRPAELRFAVGAEVAHMRFGHTRVTNGEVWDGTVDKLGSALDIAATALTLGSYAPVGKVLESKASHKLLASVFSPATLAKVYRTGDGAKAITTVGSDLTRALSRGSDQAGRAQSLTSGVSSAIDKVRGLGQTASRPSLGVDEQKLVVAHRVMQLSADRAGLVLSGDIRASVRALFLSSARYLPELAVAEQHGLDRALRRRDPEGRILHQELAIRVGAMISFYLDAEFAHLREEMAGDSEDRPQAPELVLLSSSRGSAEE